MVERWASEVLTGFALDPDGVELFALVVAARKVHLQEVVCSLQRPTTRPGRCGRNGTEKLEKLQFDVFVENPQGATTKTHHDEEKLVPLFEEPVSWPYPYGYGFVIGVEGGDGDSLDVFVISKEAIPKSTRLTCSAIALVEQWQNDDEDHDVIAVPVDELADADSINLEQVQANIEEHMAHVFSHDPNRTLRVGRLLPAEAAEALIRGEVGLRCWRLRNRPRP